MLSLNKSSKTIDIHLDEEKYYFPGQIIKGFVNVHPKSPTKTNRIVLKFMGEVSLSMKEKDTICLFQHTENIQVHPDDNEQAKFTMMEAKLYTFPFEFVVPDDIQLPSTMEFNKKARIRYTLSALHDKPMVPESLCPKVEYPVHILEFIDIENNKYKTPQDKTGQVTLNNYNQQQASVRISVPRYGFTRGDIIPLSLVIHHVERFMLAQAIDISLIRTVEIRNNKNTHVKEDILKSTKCDIDINGAAHFSQTMKRQLLIPTSTPPSIQFRDTLLRIQYKVRINAQLSYPQQQKKQQQQQQQQQQQEGACTIDIPIVVGTWPRASIPIDDDDDNNEVYQDNEFMELKESGSGPAIIDNNSTISDGRGNQQRQQQQVNSNSTIYFSQLERLRSASSSYGEYDPSKSLTSESLSGNSSTSTIKLTPKSSPTSPQNNDIIGRSDSLASRSSAKSAKSFTSYSSYRSSQSWETSSASLSRNTSLSTSISESCKTPTVSTSSISPIPSETILMTAAPCFNSNKNLTPLHRGSDITVTANRPLTPKSHSFYENDQSDQQDDTGTGLDRHSRTSPQHSLLGNGSLSNNVMTTSTPSAVTLLMPASPNSTTSSRHRYSSSSLSDTYHDGPSSVMAPLVTNTILLQPVESKEAVPAKKTIVFPLAAGSSSQRHQYTIHDDDSDDDDDDDEDLLAIVKKKQERTLLEERTRLHMTEMKI